MSKNRRVWKDQYDEDPLTGHVWHSIDGWRRCLRCACKPSWDLGKQPCPVPVNGPWAYNMMQARFKTEKRFK